MPRIYLGLGSNSPDQLHMLSRARILMNIYIGPLKRVSKIYKTAPWGYEDQPSFSNQVVSLDSNKEATWVYNALLKVEQLLDKQKDSKYGPRNIDIDFLLYGDARLQFGNVEIPHPRMHERNFVLIPLAEIAPDLLFPGTTSTIRQLAAACTDEGSVSLQMINE